MYDILSITFPIFAAVAIGYATVARGLFSGDELQVLGRYVVNIALPALLFGAVAERDLGEVLNPSYLTVYAVGAFAAIAVTVLALRLQGTGPARRAIAAMGVSCPNSGYVGYPVLLLAFPDLAAPALAMNVIVENFLMIPFCLVLLDLSREREDRTLARVVGGILLGVVRRPFVIGLFVGLAVSLSGLPVPAPVGRLADILAASASALALFVIGGSLVGLPMRGNWALAVQIAAGKLMAHPALTALALLALPLVGLPLLPEPLAAVAILSAAMPMLGIYAIFAQPYGHEGVASMALLVTTAGAFVTLTVLLALLA
ncbi:AEC family transporter [Tranquillimonas alkanivorans]|uniref:Permease n=1 Tax=Tranquillimonas alkanivorans TaxID=441119 RepID=A0A1I5L617_9RHOB|nr:AEC family transporter [Tranquillimonas alkanivorans]SFO92306.1 hypothetical protein SAMN04488047_101465 [Tranquillimonas alkanivorans]